MAGALALRGQADPAGQAEQGANSGPPAEYCPGGHNVCKRGRMNRDENMQERYHLNSQAAATTPEAFNVSNVNTFCNVQKREAT